MISPKRLFISFSGGETSAEMAIRILQNNEMRAYYGDIIIGVANTSAEKGEWREFVNKCDKEFFSPAGFPLVWIESVIHHGERTASSHKVVSFEKARMDKSVFEDMIKKYGIPNPKYPHCTRELKLNPIKSYLESVGWAAGYYDTAIGIRADEIDRISISAKERRIIYPLIKWGVTKPQVNSAWRNRNFRLNLKGYQSNCEFCYKKSFRKHLTIISENPEVYDFPREMEREYPYVGGEFSRSPRDGQTPLPDGYRRKFFRNNLDTNELFDLYEEKKDTFTPAEDDAQIYPNPSLFDELLDTPGGCGGESCEIFGDDE